MGSGRKRIEDKKSVLGILQWCLENEAVFETIDRDGNLVRLRLDAVLRAESGIRGLFTQKRRLLLPMSLRIRPFCTPILAGDQIYTIYFQHSETTYSIEGTLVESDPENLTLTFSAPCMIVRHGRRRSRRISGREVEEIRILIETELFEISDMSLTGIGIITSRPERFQPGRELELQVLIRGRTFHARGRVEHVTARSQGKFVCGIDVEYLDEENLCLLQKLMHASKGGEKR